MSRKPTASPTNNHALRSRILGTAVRISQSGEPFDFVAEAEVGVTLKPEAKVRARLEEWSREAIVSSFGTALGANSEAGRVEPSDIVTRLVHEAVSTALLKEMQLLTSAAERDQVWSAVAAALKAGQAAMFLRVLPALSSKTVEAFRAECALLKQEPDAVRGRKVKAAAAQGGRDRTRAKKGPGAAALTQELVALRAKRPTLTWTAACEFVARKHKLSRPTVQAQAACASWARKRNQ